MTDYLYYIGIGSIDSKSLKKDDRPKIRKVNKNCAVEILKIIGKELEGPFISLTELKNKSKIYSSIENSKTKQSILNPKNIKEFDKITLLPFEHTYELNFIKLFLHVWIGKIQKTDISGIHFYTPENTKLIKILEIDEESGIYSAMISHFDKEKDIWVDKSNPTHFFPDNWTIQKLFKELDIAYLNKTHYEDSIYYGYTSENIKVKIIIKNDNALTMYPVIR
jgi:hypothetical protein